MSKKRWGTHFKSSADWYYTVELTPGVFTDGAGTKNFSLTRKILTNVSVEGQDCLDLGTMEGVVPTLLKKRGAAHVVAYDRMDHETKINEVKSAYDVEWDYLKGMTLGDLPEKLAERGLNIFDVVIFSGVLYHMFDPLSGLAYTRALLRTGGITIIETACLMDESVSLHFNEAGRFFPRTNFFIPSLPGLDAMLRFVRLQPLDVIYFPAAKRTGPQIVRACIACRAVDDPIKDADDKWTGQKFKRDFEEHKVFFSELKSNKPDVGYTPINEKLVYHDGMDSIDIYASCLAQDPFTDKVKLSVLHLDDEW